MAARGIEGRAGRAPDGRLGFLHVDMDAFFASCELVRRPELRNQPVVVGGTGHRGVVAAASYIARSFGIFSAMPAIQARRLCPHAIFLEGDHDHYAEVSARIMAVFHDVTPLVEPLSLDEAFLDIRGALHGRNRSLTIARELRARMLEQEGLTCSIGVATNKFLAKLATERAKPRPSKQGPVFGSGVHVVAPGEELLFLHPHPVRDLWGVGPATAAKLAAMGIETVADLAAQPAARVMNGLGNSVGRQLHRLAHAIDERPVIVDQRVKSIGREETFPRDLVDQAVLRREIVRLSDAVGSRLRSAGLVGRTVTIKVRFADFTTITRSQSQAVPVAGAHTIRDVADALFSRVDISSGVRLLGVSVNQLAPLEAQQLSLDDLSGQNWNVADNVIGEIRKRFGGSSIGSATLARSGKALDRMEKGQQQWGPNDVA